MKEIEVKVTKYIAEDGTQFDSKELCEKHDVECGLIRKNCESRIEMIRAKRSQLDDEAEKFRLKKEHELEELFLQVRSMKDRIQSLISISKELSENKFNHLDCWSYGTCRVGFCTAYYDADVNNRAVGVSIRKNDVCRLEYKTNGDAMMSIKNDSLEDKISIVSYFLKDFDRFESKFYEWLDNEMK